MSRPRGVDDERLRDLLAEAVDLAEANVADGGGPFGALVVRGDVVVGRGVNRVVADRDPTAHAEVVAVRDACRRLGTHDLGGCLLVASCQPCPLCRSAAWWARVARVVHAATAADAARAGFDDAVLADELRVPAGGPQARLRHEHVVVPGADRPFRAWARAEARVPY